MSASGAELTVRLRWSYRRGLGSRSGKGRLPHAKACDLGLRQPIGPISPRIATFCHLGSKGEIFNRAITVFRKAGAFAISTTTAQQWNQAYYFSLFERVSALAQHYRTPVRHTVLAHGAEPLEHVASFERRLAGISLGTRHGSVFLPGGLNMTHLARLVTVHLREAPPVDQARFKLGLPQMTALPREFQLQEDGYDLRLQTVEHREMLFLPDDYETFVARLSANARSNIRRCRKRAGELGLNFKLTMANDALDLRALRDLARHNLEGPRPFSNYRTFLKYRSERGQSFRAELLDEDGVLVSVAGGVIGGEAATMFLQNNHGDFRHASPSLTLRAMLIEALIEQRVTSLLFTDGCGGTLRSACQPSLTGGLVVTRTTAGPRIRRAVIGASSRYARQVAKTAAGVAAKVLA